MSAHHCPRILACREGCWSECRCGWVSLTMTTRIGASVAWAEHVQSHLARVPLCGEPGYTHCPDCGVDKRTRHRVDCPQVAARSQSAEEMV